MRAGARLMGLAPHRFAPQNAPHPALRATFPQGKAMVRVAPLCRLSFPRSLSLPYPPSPAGRLPLGEAVSPKG